MGIETGCDLCINKEMCYENHWCVTFDKGMKVTIEGIQMAVCDNYECRMEC